MAKRRGVSIKDVARESNSSLTTVSLVLNNRDLRISQATRERILKAVAKLGYRPSRLAQGLQAQKTAFLAILVPQIQHAFADPYFGELISAIHDRATESDYKILIEVAHPRFIREQRHLDLFGRHYVDGMLCLGVTDKDRYLEVLEERGYPALIVNNHLPGSRLNYVRCDYEAAGRIAGKHLVKLGHRRIGLIHGATDVETNRELQRGFRAALRAAKVSLPAKHLDDGLYTEEGGAAAAAALLKRVPDLTAIMAGNDKMAIGAMRTLKDMGRRVPEDISVIGCDDIHQSAFCDPPLTTIRTPLYELGRQACELLLAICNGEVDTVAEVYPVELTLRKSTAPVRP